MTPEELDAIEARYTLTDDAWTNETAIYVPDLIDALREAWAERDDLFTRASIASGDARYLRAALDRVRALCESRRTPVSWDAGYPNQLDLLTPEQVLRAIDGEAS